MVVPVPLHPRRTRIRGFNQAEILAEAIAPGLDIPVVPALVRARDTQPQVRLRADQRRENVENAFAVDDGHLETLGGSRVLLVDDVLTTGATLGSAAAELQGAGVSRIYGLTLVRDR